MYKGCLSIPYLRHTEWSDQKWSSASIRFRKLDGSKPKYMTVSGDRTRLFNTVDLTRNYPDVSITEGEIDAITLVQAGIPAVGVPGAQVWKPYFRELFYGYRHVNVFADGDDAGMAFARSIAKDLSNARAIPMPDGEDINSMHLKHGKEALLERIS